MKKICVAGLNPSWQKTLFFNGIKYGSVNRASSVTATASGKGVNFARAVKTWNLCRAGVCQFAGGANGERLCKAMENEGIEHITQKIISETRICSTLVPGGGEPVTEIIEPSPCITKSESLAMLCAMREAIAASDALAICGTYPADIGKDFYADIADAARKNGKLLFIDSFSGIEATLSSGVTDVLKINLDELKALTKKDSVQSAFTECLTQYAINVLAVTDGAEKAYIATKSNPVPEALNVPVIENVVNTIGCGDTCSGVMLSEILNGTDELKAFKLGLAAASANCMTPEPACFDPETARGLAV